MINAFLELYCPKPVKCPLCSASCVFRGIERPYCLECEDFVAFEEFYLDEPEDKDEYPLCGQI